MRLVAFCLGRFEDELDSKIQKGSGQQGRWDFSQGGQSL
jgi:hypothetical protein